MNLLKPPCDEVVIAAKGPTAPCTKERGRWILAATILGSSMVFIDGTVVNVALPALQANLSATSVDVQWVVESYALFLAALLLLGGSLGDHFGRRRIYAIGVMLFALASVWCGLAPNISQLIVARAVQGIGGAMLVPGGLAIISAAFPEEDRGQAIGTWSGSTAITTALGPVIGGWLIEHVSWRAVFFLNLPLAVIVLLLVVQRVPESRNEEESRKLDFLGAGLATLSLGAIVYGLIESSRLGLQSPTVIAALVAGTIIFGAFILVEARVQHPMMPLTLFSSRNFAGANMLTLFLYASLAGTLFFMPLNLIQVQGYSATAAGAATLPFILIMFLLSRWSGGLVKRYGARLPLVVGFGMAISVAPLTTTVMNSVNQSHAGIASGVNNAVSRTAGLLAVAVFGLIMFHAFNGCLDQRLNQMPLTIEVRQALNTQRIKLAAADLPRSVDEETRMSIKQAIDECFVFGFGRVMLVGAALALAGSALAWLMIRDR